MRIRTVARMGLSALAALVVLLSAVAAGYTQTDTQAAGQIYLPLIRQAPQRAAVDEASEETAEEVVDDLVDAAGRKIRPTIILVHGAWADATGWQEVIKRLQDKDYPVLAVQNPLTSLADDVATTKRLIDAESAKGPVIVVGHSYGGAVITGAAAGNPNVKALVYIAAFGPEVGEPIGALLGQYPTELGTILEPDAAGFVYLNRQRFREIFAADVSRSEAAVMAAAQKPANGHIFQESLTDAAWKTIPSWFMVAKEDKALSPAMERFYAQRMGATIVEIKSSHVPFISKPSEVVKLIEKAIKATMQ